MNIEYEKLKTDAIIINVKNIIAQCLKRVKLILSSCIICALVLSGIVYVKDTISYNIATSSSTSGTDESELTDEDKMAVQKYVYLKEQLDQMNNHKENSLYMQLEASNVFQGVVVYQVSSDAKIKNDIANAMVSYVNEGGLVSQIANSYTEIEEKYLQEIIRAEVVGAEEGTPSGVVNIYVWSDSEELNAEIVKYVCKNVESFGNSLKKELGNFSLNKIQEIGSIRYMDSIYQDQKDFYKELETIKEDFNKHKATMTEYQLLGTQENGETNSENEVKIPKPSFSIKYAIVGALLGAVLIIFYICLVTILGGRIQTEKEIGQRLGLVHLGNVFITKSTLLNKMLLQLLYGKKVDELDAETKVLVSRISMYLADKNAKRIAFVGTTDDLFSKEIEIVTELLKNVGVESIVSGDVLSDFKAMNSLTEVEYIILVETIGKSKIKKVYEEAAICMSVKAEVLGYISVHE